MIDEKNGIARPEFATTHQLSALRTQRKLVLYPPLANTLWHIHYFLPVRSPATSSARHAKNASQPPVFIAIWSPCRNFFRPLRQTNSTSAALRYNLCAKPHAERAQADVHNEICPLKLSFKWELLFYLWTRAATPFCNHSNSALFFSCWRRSV